MLFLVLCFQVMLAPETILQKMARNVSVPLSPGLVFCMSPPRLIDIFAGSVRIRVKIQTSTSILVKFLDIAYANCD